MKFSETNEKHEIDEQHSLGIEKINDDECEFVFWKRSPALGTMEILDTGVIKKGEKKKIVDYTFYFDGKELTVDTEK